MDSEDQPRRVLGDDLVQSVLNIAFFFIDKNELYGYSLEVCIGLVPLMSLTAMYCRFGNFLRDLYFAKFSFSNYSRVSIQLT